MGRGWRGGEATWQPLPFWPWKWATLTWAHPGCPHTGPHVDTGSDPGSRSPPAVHRPFLGEEPGRGRREAAPSPCSARQSAQRKSPVDTAPFCAQEWGSCTPSPPTDTQSPHTRILQGALASVVAHAIHTGASIGTRVLHTVICVHPTVRSFKARRTGAPVRQGRRERQMGPWPEQQSVATGQYRHPRVLVPTLDQALPDAGN